jgi:hypothetical protein
MSGSIPDQANAASPSLANHSKQRHPTHGNQVRRCGTCCVGPAGVLGDRSDNSWQPIAFWPCVRLNQCETLRPH